MAIGLMAFAVLLATAWWASGRYALGGVMATSLTAWALTVAALGHVTARSSKDAGREGARGDLRSRPTSAASADAQPTSSRE